MPPSAVSTPWCVPCASMCKRIGTSAFISFAFFEWYPEVRSRCRLQCGSAPPLFPPHVAVSALDFFTIGLNAPFQFRCLHQHGAPSRTRAEPTASHLRARTQCANQQSAAEKMEQWYGRTMHCFAGNVARVTPPTTQQYLPLRPVESVRTDVTPPLHRWAHSAPRWSHARFLRGRRSPDESDPNRQPMASPLPLHRQTCLGQPARHGGR
ncbi:hypothetical protein DFR29_10449 [Tahibacter aquaticus]|uniref:Uncharacterized protein n=1 Tax=Tahibacter aquaticus TaxID=520092 RepID=A0A4R6Z224_9GAMM|nr:hypothetical protein DFR29_10449 [Tahibacter aquaticus]